MSIFRASTTPDVPLVVSVTGVRLGQHVLVLPGADRSVLFDLAARVGLTGRTLAFADGADATARLQQESEAAGVVADVAMLEVPLPVGGDSFDVAVVDSRTSGHETVASGALFSALRQALRPGGRIIVLLPAGGGLVARLFGGSTPPAEARAVVARLEAAGFRSSRLVAVHGGVGYLEATRPVA